MRLVKTPHAAPSHCAVLPHIGGTHEQGYIDTLSELPGFDNHVYVSVVAVKEMARLIGLPTEADMAELQAARERIAELEAANTELQKAVDATAVLKNTRLYVAEKKPGRPPKKPTPQTQSRSAA